MRELHRERGVAELIEWRTSRGPCQALLQAAADPGPRLFIAALRDWPSTDTAGDIEQVAAAAWTAAERAGFKPSAGVCPTPRGTAEHAPLARSITDLASYLDVITDGRHQFTAALAGPALPTPAVWLPGLGQPGAGRELDPATVAVAHSAAQRLQAAGVLQLYDGVAVALSDPAAAWHQRRAHPTGPPPPAVRQDQATLDELTGAGAVLLTPTTPAGPHGHDGPGQRLSVALTWTLNLTGHPAISLPAGHDPAGCPVGLQIVAGRGSDAALLKLAAAASLEDHPPEFAR